MAKRSAEHALATPEKRHEAEPDAKPTPLLTFHTVIGEGVYGKVVLSRFDGGLYATKLPFYDPRNFLEDTPSVIRELLVGGACSAGAGVERVAVVRLRASQQYGIISALGACSLRHAVKAFPRVPLHAVRVIGKALLERIAQMHAGGAMHRDLKPENVLLSWPSSRMWPDVRLIDFGLSSPQASSKNPSVVTLWWRAPEVLLHAEHTHRVDVWAFGVMLHNMCAAAPLTTAMGESEALRDVWQKIGRPTTAASHGLHLLATHAAALPVVRAALRPMPSERMSAEELLFQPFWSEVPTADELEDAGAWALKVAATFADTACGGEPCTRLSRDAFDVVSFDAGLDAKQGAYLRFALEHLREEHVRAAVRISKHQEWPRDTLETCVILMDVALGARDAPCPRPATLAASAGYVTAILYSDLEPSLVLLKEWSEAMDTLDAIESGVHEVLRATGFRLLKKELCAAVKAMPEWRAVEAWM